MTRYPEPEPCIGVHEHACPRCHERKLCTESCTRVRDQEANGIQAGAIVACDDCERTARANGYELTVCGAVRRLVVLPTGEVGT